MSKEKVYGVFCNDSENNQFLCVTDGEGYRYDGNCYPAPVTKKEAKDFVESFSMKYPDNIYTVFKMKFKETI